MQDKNNSGTDPSKLKEEDEKILYSANNNVCFACGEKIDRVIKICPYCKTPTV